MVKKALLLLAAAAGFSGVAKAQQHVHNAHCFTDEKHAEAIRLYPQIAENEQALKAQIRAQMEKMDLGQFKTTAEDGGFFDNEQLNIPIVFHIIHDYGSEYITDNEVYTALKEINQMFNNTTPDTAGIIAPFAGKIRGTNVKYAGNARITFKLPTKDPLGQPTHGIVRHRSYLTTQASDQAKYDSWPTHRYMNIWIVRAFNANHSGAAAYAYKPVTGEVIPWADGVIGILQNGLINYDNTLAHELGHSLNLDHPWGGTNQPEVACGDDDVDDTPPTRGHEFGGCSAENLYDYECILTDSISGKTVFNPALDITDNLNDGISFLALQKVNLDFVTFYPGDSGAAYQIVLRNLTNNAIVGSYSGTTSNNKKRDTLGRTINATTPVGTMDSLVGNGITFRVFDSLIIDTVFFYTPPTVGGPLPYEIVLKQNGVIVDSYMGTVDNSATSAALITAPVGFNIPGDDSTDVYKLEFAVNPGALRGTQNIVGEKTIAGVVNIIKDTTGNKYNYFYNWKVKTFNFAQVVPVRFTAPQNDSDGYKLEFAVNPGARRDLGAATNDSSAGVILLDDTTGGYYNYFYNWVLRFGDYYKVYSPSQAYYLFGDSTDTYIDYPDTTNSQNVMDYTYCSKMFTHLQTLRMRLTLRNNVADRDQLVTSQTAQITGINDPWPDLPPVADFSVDRAPVVTGDEKVFICATTAGSVPNITFRNRSWRDTVTSLNWTFSNDADIPTQAASGAAINVPVNNKFATPGWVTVSLVATSNAGSDTITRTNAVYIADPATVPSNYIAEFDPAVDRDQYPIFNYFGNKYKWEYVGHGTYDNYGIRYNNFETRQFPPFGIDAYIGTAGGDYDDFFTRAFNPSELNSSGSSIFLNFFSSGATRTSDPSEMRDTLEIAYSTNCGNNWTVLKKLRGVELSNMGTANPLNEYVPGGPTNWKGQSIALPAGVKSAQRVYFRFRYRPGTNNSYYGTGNHFYMDRIGLSNWTASVSTPEFSANGFVLAPNPTTGSTSVIIKSSNSKSARIVVTDITGKMVYGTESVLNNNINRVEIPANALTVKGVYLVTVTTGTTRHTEKLVVY